MRQRELRLQFVFYTRSAGPRKHGPGACSGAEARARQGARNAGCQPQNRPRGLNRRRLDRNSEPQLTEWGGPHCWDQ